MNLDEFKAGLIDQATTYRLYGHELESDEVGQKARRDGRKWLSFLPCFCVHDSIDSPCRCMPDGHWWVPEASILNRGSADRRDPHGKSMDFIDIALDADIVVESVTAISVRRLKEIGDDLPDVVDAFGGGNLGVVFALKPKINWKKVLLFLGAVGEGIVASIAWDAMKYAWEQSQKGK